MQAMVRHGWRGWLRPLVPVSTLNVEGTFGLGVSWNLRRNPFEKTRVER